MKPARVSAYFAVVSFLLLLIAILGISGLSFLMGKWRVENNLDSTLLLRKYILLSAQLGFATIIAVLISLPIWTYQICKNINYRLNADAKLKPVLAAWSWLIPIANLFLPFNYLRKCWYGLQDNFPITGMPIKKPNVITLWQIAFCIFMFALILHLIIFSLMTKNNFNLVLYSIVMYLSLLSVIINIIIGCVSILQLLRLEKLVYTTR